MLECLGLLVIMMIGYVIYQNWSLITTVFWIILGVVALYIIGKILFYICGAIAEWYREWSGIIIIEKEKKRAEISVKIKGFVNGNIPNRYSHLKIYLDSLQSREMRDYAKRLLEEHADKIHQEVLSMLSVGEYEEAIERITVLKSIASDASKEQMVIYDNMLKKADEVKKLCTSVGIYIMSNDYGKPNMELLKIYEEIPPDGIRSNMDRVGLINTLWYFTINHDKNSYLAVFNLLNKLKTSYNVISIDVLASLMYLEQKFGSDYVVQLYGSYRDKKREYIKAAGPVALKNLASFCNYIGDYNTEKECLEKLKAQNNSTPAMSQRYAALAKV